MKKYCFCAGWSKILAGCFLLVAGCAGFGFSCRETLKTYVFNDVDMANTFQYGAELEIAIDKEYLRNEVIVFEQNDSVYGYRLNEKAALRLVGVPGDEVYIEGGRTYVNHKLMPIRKTDKRPYICNLSSLDNYDAMVKIVEASYGYMLNNYYGFVNLDSAEYIDFAKMYTVHPLEQFGTDTLSDSILVKKVNIVKKKNIMPPVFVPRKGDTIEITTANAKYYKHGLPLWKSLGRNRYVVEENMYMLLGDNWGYAVDSRYYGLITESQIVGTLSAR